MRDAFRGYIPAELLDTQVEEFEKERAGVEREREEAGKFIADQFGYPKNMLNILCQKTILEGK